MSSSAKELFEKTASTRAKESYSASDITILEGLEPVRMRPGMYIGGTDERAYHHLASEIIDNSMDEVVAGHADKIEVELREDGYLIVTDNGRGIPIDPHPKYKDKSALEIIFTTLHAGGKFNGDAYQTSGGLHGVGSSVVNALSEELIVEVARSKTLYRQSYARGITQTRLEKVGGVSRRGTRVLFKPDPQIFGSSAHFKPGRLYKNLKSKAYLFKGVKLVWSCPATLIKDDTPSHDTLYFPNGLQDYLTERTENMPLVIDDIFAGEADFSDAVGRAEWALSWIEAGDVHLASYCNTIPTPLGGTHEQGIRNALSKGIKNYAQLRHHKKGAIITPEDVMSRIMGVLSVFIREPEFQGQTKERLSSQEATARVEKAIRDRFESWLARDSARSDALLEHIIDRAEERLRKKKEKDISRASATKRLRLPGKLADCSEQSQEGTEIFLVEGDSAGGSAKQARNRKIQAILPLRGKILNVAGATAEKLRANQELSDLLLALGCGMGKNCNPDTLRYEKVIIMTDADVDGAHIAALLITFFYRELRPLIERGHLYLAVPPLYRLSHGGKSFYARDEQHRDEILQNEFKNKKNVEIGRFKGLGEMMPKQLRETTMHPDSRTLIRLGIPFEEKLETDDIVERLMGKKAELRYEYITQNAAFAQDLDV
ncbi:MAG: DNA topoisomerase IV subunit B [Pseudomonadota bacterium]